MKPRILKSMPPRIPRQREGMDAKHLANVRQLPCLVCGNGTSTLTLIQAGVQPHHLLRSGERGLSYKSADRWAIPLCFHDHNSLHAAGDEDAWLAECGIDGRAVAAALWSERDDLEKMRRVIDRARSMARLKLSQTSIAKRNNK